MNKYDYNSQMIYYQKARFFRKINTNEFAYCIEPFAMFNENFSYNSTLNPHNLSSSQIDRISKIAHFGYGYSNHTDSKWYAITQFMIWKETNNGDYYFTDSLNGNRINIFQDEINEINNLINEYNTLPEFDDEYTLLSGNAIIFKRNLKNTIVTGENLKQDGNKLVVNPSIEGEYTYNVLREDNIYNKPYIFYESNNSQDMLIQGDIKSINKSFKVKVIKPEIKVTKIDEDTQSIIPSGEGKLDGATFTLTNENNEVIKELTIENNQSIINDIPLGKYYIKETTPGEGYLLNNNTYEINITKENTKQQITIENKIIEKTITIEKKYGNTNSLMAEANISFDIYNSNNEKIYTITTNNLGIASITLPYGKYTLKQINTTEGYKKIDDITIIVDNTEDELIELKDLRIEVPNTSTNDYLLILIIKYLLTLW